MPVAAVGDALCAAAAARFELAPGVPRAHAVMADPRAPGLWMWAQACALADSAEQLHRQFFRPVSSAQAFTVWEPPVDVYEDAHDVLVVVALPGVALEQVELQADVAALTVRAVRRAPLQGDARLVRRLEIPYGRFERHILLPPGDLVGEAQLTHGCLVLTWRKRTGPPR
jgi:HSP20 family protein